MQQNVRNTSSGGEDMLLAVGLVLAVIGGGIWFLWFKFHPQIAGGVMGFQHWQMAPTRPMSASSPCSGSATTSAASCAGLWSPCWPCCPSSA